jgi:hypothetical protein
MTNVCLRWSHSFVIPWLYEKDIRIFFIKMSTKLQINRQLPNLYHEKSKKSMKKWKTLGKKFYFLSIKFSTTNALFIDSLLYVYRWILFIIFNGIIVEKQNFDIFL